MDLPVGEHGEGLLLYTDPVISEALLDQSSALLFVTIPEATPPMIKLPCYTNQFRFRGASFHLGDAQLECTPHKLVPGVSLAQVKHIDGTFPDLGHLGIGRHALFQFRPGLNLEGRSYDACVEVGHRVITLVLRCVMVTVVGLL